MIPNGRVRVTGNAPGATVSTLGAFRMGMEGWPRLRYPRIANRPFQATRRPPRDVYGFGIRPVFLRRWTHPDLRRAITPGYHSMPEELAGFLQGVRSARLGFA
jgi:hypothetical protein